MDAHSRDRNMLPSATALGASMLQATCFLVKPVGLQRFEVSSLQSDFVNRSQEGTGDLFV